MTRVLELPGLLPSDVVRQTLDGLATAPFKDGRSTALGNAREVKRNLHLEATAPLAQQLGGPILAALGRSDAFKGLVFPHTILPFTFARYEPGMAYGDHVDLPVMGTARGPLRTDLSITVFLSGPDDCEGGELVLQGDQGELRLKGQAGDAVVYPSHTVHRVDPVTVGVRLVAISWIQSLVADPEERALLGGLSESLAHLTAAGAPEAELLRLRNLQYRLLRRWAAC